MEAEHSGHSSPHFSQKMVAGLSHSKHKLSGTMDDDEKEGLEVVD